VKHAFNTNNKQIKELLTEKNINKIISWTIDSEVKLTAITYTEPITLESTFNKKKANYNQEK
jgi:hypothetical protein